MQGYSTGDPAKRMKVRTCRAPWFIPRRACSMLCARPQATAPAPYQLPSC